MATEKQIAWLKGLSDYDVMAEELGEYDDDIDYVGPGGENPSKLAKLIPRTAYGIDLNPAAYIHDYDYSQGGTGEDRFKADSRFLVNMYNQIEMVADGWHEFIRRHLAKLRAQKYYKAVHLVGGNFFGDK